MNTVYKLACVVSLLLSATLSYAASPQWPPRIVIIIDDIGNSYNQGAAAIALPGPVTYAVLPFSAHGKALANMAFGHDKEIMLHAPMANTLRKPLGPGGLTERQTEQQLKQTLRDNLDWVPHVVGFNNHMGSLLTQKKAPMAWLMDVAKERGIYFVDSRTTPASVALSAARAAKVPALTRDIFLDHERSEQFMQAQFDRAIRIARKFGKAVVIGHPYPSTTQFLTQAIPQLDELGIQLVSVSALLMIQREAMQRSDMALKKATKKPAEPVVQQACYLWDGTPCPTN